MEFEFELAKYSIAFLRADSSSQCQRSSETGARSTCHSLRPQITPFCASILKTKSLGSKAYCFSYKSVSISPYHSFQAQNLQVPTPKPHNPNPQPQINNT